MSRHAPNPPGPALRATEVSRRDTGASQRPRACAPPHASRERCTAGPSPPGVPWCTTSIRALLTANSWAVGSTATPAGSPPPASSCRAPAPTATAAAAAMRCRSCSPAVSWGSRRPRSQHASATMHAASTCMRRPVASSSPRAGRALHSCPLSPASCSSTLTNRLYARQGAGHCVGMALQQGRALLLARAAHGRGGGKGWARLTVARS